METNKIITRRIKKITVKENENVYDLTTEKNHNFFANNILVHNCGEIIMGVDSCRLTSINTLSFVENPYTKKSYFDFEKFEKISQLAQKLMDDMVDIEKQLIQKIIDKIESDPEPENIKQIEKDLWIKMKDICRKGRRTGLGLTSLADTFAALGIKYGSDESIKLTEKIYKKLCINAYKSSIMMAKERGSFPIFSYEIEKDNLFLNKIWKEDEDLYKQYKKYGRRNISCLTTAPNGSIAIMVQSTSGIEPVFNLSYKRRKKINPNDNVQKIDFVDSLGDKWSEFNVLHKGLKKWMDINSNKNIEDSPYYKSTISDIDWISSVDIQASAQKWICHSISKTHNLPKEATEDIVNQLFLKSYQSGCKGITVYRQGSRDGVLIDNDNCNKRINKIEKTNAPKRPDELLGETFHVTVQGEPFFIIVGLLGNDPYEIFAGNNKKEHIPKNIKNVIIKKIKRNKYSITEKENNNVIHEDISKYINEDQEAITRLISCNLRHGCDVNFIVHQLDKTTGDLMGFSKAISRVLKKYIKEGSKIAGEECEKCGGKLVRQEGCVKCESCSWTRCG